MAILDLPREDDFRFSGEFLLNSGWTSVVGLMKELEEMAVAKRDFADSPIEEKEERSYWTRARNTLQTALALVQQGTEFLVKARIVAVSPYLLVAGRPSSWPARCDREDRAFADFRTVDAQDLLRVHDTVSDQRFPEQFRTKFGEMRRMRNRTMHTVDQNFRAQPVDLIKMILSVHESVVAPQSWLNCRFQILQSSPSCSVSMFGGDATEEAEPYSTWALLEEYELVRRCLGSAETTRYFDFSKRRKSYYCPRCYGNLTAMDYFEHDHQGAVARILQFSTRSRKAACSFCGYMFRYSRGKCAACSGNRVDKESGYCIECAELN